MTDFYETWVENLDLKEEKKKSSTVAKNPGIRNPPGKGNEKILTPVLQSPSKNLLWSTWQSRNNASYMENTVLQQISTKIYIIW